MRRFEYIAPKTLKEVKETLQRGSAVAMAGGTDLVGTLKADILPEQPKLVVSLKNIDGLNKIEKKSDGLHIGAMATLEEISRSEIVKGDWQALADAAYSVASPNIRNTATIGGNICQDIRCWYYRYPNQIGGRVDCARKDGSLCYAAMGENQYHSIFGGMPVNDSPCKAECPAHTDIPAYLEAIRAGDIDKAARILMEVNPMPAITSRVCANFCMEGCNRHLFDTSINIGQEERFLGDYILDNYKDYMKAPEKENGKHVAIIGAGPGGLTAAYYLREAGYAVTIYDKHSTPGGCLAYAIPAYRLPRAMLDKYMGILEEMGIKFVLNTEVGKDISFAELKSNSIAVLLSPGTWGRPLIGFEGEQEHTTFGLDFLEGVNKKTVTKDDVPENIVVIGGGNVGIDVAMVTKRMGAKNVQLVCLEQFEDMPASAHEVEKALQDGVKIINGWGPTKVVTENDKVTGITFRRCVSVIDGQCHFNPTYDDNDVQTLKADKIYMAVGQRSDLDFLGKLGVDVERGRIQVDENLQTKVDGFYSVGDVVTGPATVIGAIADGKKVAIAINDKEEGAMLPVQKVEELRGLRKHLTFVPKYENRKFSFKGPELPIEERNLVNEDIGLMPQHNVEQEAARCFNCGCLAVNASDVATMLVAYNATVKTNERTISAEELFTTNTKVNEVLNPGEIVVEVIVPNLPEGTVAAYNKYRTRKSIDFAILSVASVYNVKDNVINDARITLGAVAPVPKRVKKAEDFLKGKNVSEEIAYQAAEIALEDAIPLRHNEYKIQMAKTMVKRSLDFNA